YDPTFALPILDGSYYVELARAGFPPGVFYMPPLYPFLLSVFMALFGTAWGALYLLQHALVVFAAGATGIAAEAISGRAAGLCAAAIVLLYHPAMFFASRPLGEPLALALSSVALALALRSSALAGASAGVAAGLAALVRPNLLPLPFLWAAADVAKRRIVRGALIAGLAVIAIAPAAWHNIRASGRLVPVSANGGVVFWLGNAPGAIGVYTPSPGFSGKLATQQQEAIAEGSARAGRALDAVEADRFWLREGLRARAGDVLGTAVLLARRAALTFDDAEHGLDYAPGLDENPVRWAAPLPFAIVAGLAVAAVVTRGFAGTGGWTVWSAVFVQALPPLAFYVSSRHRLPFALSLAIPAGITAAALPTLLATRRGRIAALAGSVLAVLSFAMPTGAVVRSGEAGSLAVLADVLRRSGDLARAERTARRATEVDAGCVVAWYNLGVIEEAAGRRDGAETAYRGALRADPSHAESNGNLGALLLSTRRADEAVALLRPAVAASPRHGPLWTNLVVGLVMTGHAGEAKAAVEDARRAGVALDPGLIDTVMHMEDATP
ncbi:MAG TPA: tetratricopeptide repeat protein, partial [Candidatus Polarisedimenticolaceae bacterium]|nr:tetratricopeptide repeat protein [Candidatus Polarisedimenticolaceae bacterium]